MITIKHRGRCEAATEKFKKFNFLFNINYLFYLFKHRILIILNSPRVCSLVLCFFRVFAVLWKKFSIYPSNLLLKKRWRKSSMRNFFIFKHQAELKTSLQKIRKLFLCKARHFPSRRVFLPFSLAHRNGKSNKNSLPVILREKQFSF